MMKLDSRFLYSEIISTYQKISHTYNFSAVSCWVTTKALYTASAKYNYILLQQSTNPKMSSTDAFWALT